MSYYTTDEQNAMDRDARNMAVAGVPLSAQLEGIQDLIHSSSVGATAAGYDIDSVALGGGAFSADADNTSGLTFAYLAGRVRFGQSIVSVAAGNIALTPSAVNYLEVDSSGTVYTNTVGWTAGRVRLYQITAGVSTISLVVSAKVLLSGEAPASISGALLTTAGATKSLVLDLGTLGSAGASVFLLPLPPVPGTISAVALCTGSTVAQSDSDYWTVGVIDCGPSGTATTAVVNSATAANSTKATGGSGFTSCVARGFALGTTATAAGDVLQITLTPNGTASVSLPNVSLRVDLQFAT